MPSRSQLLVDYGGGGKSIGKIPNLIKQAKLVGEKTDKRLYTKESCMEFHRMLLDLIEDFTESLVALHEIKHTAKPLTKGTQHFKMKVF